MMEQLSYASSGGVGLITLNRPAAKNALDLNMVNELCDVLSQIARDPLVRAVILTGSGGNFCSGGDLRGMNNEPRTPRQMRDRMNRCRKLTQDLFELDRPVIAAVDGVAYGAGFSLALLADIVLVSERARLSMVFQRVGLVPDLGALFTLPRAVGVQRAKELVLSAREIRAPEAVALGIAMEMQPPQLLASRALAIAQSFCGASDLALSLAKRGLNLSLQSDLSTMLELEVSGQSAAGSGDYIKESARRFVAREAPQFRWPSEEAPAPVHSSQPHA